MPTEKEKMLAGEFYNPSDPELVAARRLVRRLLKEYNATLEEDAARRTLLLRQMLGGYAPGVWLEPPFYCDYGTNIYLGENVYFNFNCVVLDVAPVRIGAHTMFGPSVQIYTATHPLDWQERMRHEYAKPITIGANVWVGGHTVFCPGVTVGDRTIIGAGSVVTKDLPPDVLAVGNPCRVVRALGEGERGELRERGEL